MPRLKYNAPWPDGHDDLAIELSCIAMGGKWTSKSGVECGLGSFEHYMNARKLAWPERYRHRWTDTLYREFIANDITIMMGAASTQKTSHASEFVLLSYWARPNNTLAILSTITMDKLDTGVFGEVKMLWQSGKARYHWLAGHLLEHKRAITTDNLEESGVRDMRKGIVGKACYTGGKWVGLGILAGTKQENILYLCDEIQFMAESFIGSWPNMFSNGNVKVIGSGNPKHDPDDQLGIAAEPKQGWNQMPVPEKTEIWETQFMGGRCVNLVGTDSPNFDVAEGEPEPYPKLIGRKFAKRIAHDWRENSPEYYTQVKGVMRIDMADARVITRQVCREFHAQDVTKWAGTSREQVLGLDPSYGGGDECIGTFLAWGRNEDGKDRVTITEQKRYDIDMSQIDKVSPEVQVAKQVKADLDARGMKPDHAFYDPYGKGTMGFAFSQVFGGDTPIPIDSGGQPTERPVREGLYVDEKDGRKRPKTCREHYSKFVTEAWFSVRYLVEADQLRNLPLDCMLEGCARKYTTVAGNKLEVESKDDYKARCKHSPNKFDSLAIAVEGARQCGLGIDKLGKDDVHRKEERDWFDKEAREYSELIQGGLLNHSGRRRSTSLNMYGS